MNPEIFKKWWYFLMIVKTRKARKYINIQVIVFIASIGMLLLTRLLNIDSLIIYNEISISVVLGFLIVISLLLYILLLPVALIIDKKTKELYSGGDGAWSDNLKRHSKPPDGTDQHWTNIL